MPYFKPRQRRNKEEKAKRNHERREGREPGSQEPSAPTRGERKKMSLNETPTPIEQGGDE